MEAVRTAVLRVKRKRSAEPAEALVLACKRLRSGEVESLAQKTPERLDRAAENNVFQLVATVRSQEEPIQPFVRAALHPSRDSQQRIRRDLRATAGEIRKKGRYRVISARRATGTSGSLECEYASGASEAAGDSGFQLLDLVHEEGDPAEAASADSSKTSDPDVILCNSVELIRERLTISEDRPGVGHQEEQKHDDYVYDIYYLETATPGWIENILSVQPYTQEWELVNDEPPEDTYDDEDDENSENNWRNEYPEEESSDGDEDSRGSDEYDSLSEEERGSRKQVWSKYPLDVQKEFGYDNLQDLDSD